MKSLLLLIFTVACSAAYLRNIPVVRTIYNTKGGPKVSLERHSNILTDPLQ